MFFGTNKQVYNYVAAWKKQNVQLKKHSLVASDQKVTNLIVTVTELDILIALDRNLVRTSHAPT